MASSKNKVKKKKKKKKLKKKKKKKTPGERAPAPLPLPATTVQQVHVRSFDEALKGLLTDPLLVREENLSFPNENTPLSCDNVPIISGDTKICELHHGSWWRDSWKKLCSGNTDEILVPLIFYMDGTTIDKGRKMSLCPLQMTLGIFNVKTRREARAWQTIYFSPKGTTNCDDGYKGAANLHLGLEQALRSVREACSGSREYEWSNLPWNGTEWKVKMKFAVAYVIGDTEMHDKFSGRKPVRNHHAPMLCRHCDCPYADTSNPRCNIARSGNTRKLWTPEDFANPTDPNFFKNVCHYDLSNANAFYPLDFGANQHSIHLATPGEKLHMHQLGAAKRFVETFETFTGKATVTRNVLAGLAEDYGKALARQSERELPRTRFPDHLNAKNKEGKHFSGMLLTIILALVSVDGQNALSLGQEDEVKAERKAGYRGQIEAAELILGMEEFLTSLHNTKNDYRNFPKMIVHFLNVINRHCVRNDGTGNKLVKLHLYFHLPKYIELWGPPDGWDSSHCESNHKTEIKAPAQKTQMNTSTLIEQTANRHMEYRLIDRLSYHVKENDNEASTPAMEPTPPLSEGSGSKFTISVDGDNHAAMTWDSPEMRNRQVHNKDILEYCLKVIQQAVDGNTVKGCTENKRYDATRQKKCIFRAHPSFRDEGLQRHGVWYDWAKFVYKLPPDPKYFGAQILCFLDLRNNILDTDDARHLLSNGPGLYAVVREFRDGGVHNVDGTTIIKEVSMSEELALHHCDTIFSELAVVENFGSKNPRTYFVVHSRDKWLSKFKKKMKELRSKTFDAILKEGE